MRALRIAAIAGGAAVILLVGGIAVVAGLLHPEHIKTELAKAALANYQRTLKIDGELELSLWPSIGVRLGGLSLSEHASAQQFARIGALRLSVAVRPLLSKRLVVDTVEVQGLQAAIVRRADGTLNIDDLIPADEAGSPPMQLDIAGVKLIGAELAWRDEKSGDGTAISGLDLATGRVQADTGARTFRIDTLTLAARGIAGGDARLALGGVEGAGGALKAARLALEFAAKSGAASVKGGLAAALAADLEQRKLALEKLSGDLDLAHPRLPMKHLKLPLAGTLRADFARQSAAGDLAAQLDGSKIALKFAVAKFAPLALDFELDIDKFDADRYLPEKKTGEKGGGKLDFSALRGANINGAVRIGSLRVAKVTAANVELRVRAADGGLDIGPRQAPR